MNKWKIAFWFCFALLISISLISIYIILDQGVSLTYQKEEYTNTVNDLDQIIKLINETDLTKNQITPILQNHEWVEYMNLESDTVELKTINLIFEEDTLKEILR